jgi:hypothetical protein
MGGTGVFSGAETTPEPDAVIDTSTHRQGTPSGRYELPVDNYLLDGWQWIVLDFEVTAGQLDLDDVFFRGLFEADLGKQWAVVTIDVEASVLNVEDGLFRSRLVTDAGPVETSPFSRYADRGIRNRGLVKAGHRANARYEIGEDESVVEWGYADDARQDVTVRRK